MKEKDQCTNNRISQDDIKSCKCKISWKKFSNHEHDVKSNIYCDFREVDSSNQ